VPVTLVCVVALLKEKEIKTQKESYSPAYVAVGIAEHK
jgi:hypothetical protein